MKVHSLWVAALGFVISCASADGSSTTESAATEASALPCGVEALLKEKCQTCHGARPTAGAPMPLRSYADLTASRNGKKVYELVKERIHASSKPMPPTRLDSAGLATLDSWIDAGAPRSTESCGGTPAALAEVPTLQPLECDGTRTSLQASEPFEMKAGAPLDQYICFGIDVERSEKQHLIGFGPKVDNDQILHHILVFQSEERVDAKPHLCEQAGAASWTMIGGWAPGGTTKQMPPEAGFPEEKGTTHYAIQLHYNNALGLAGAKDRSGMELCSTTKLRPNDAGIAAFGMLRSISIPPRKARHSVSCEYKWKQDGIQLFSASPHMHKRGRQLKTATANGAVITDEPQFDFEQQLGTAINMKLSAGDVVRTTCVWENPDDKTIGWGEGTDDEMCFNFVGYYPKRPMSWVEPSLAADNCTVE
jgi:mono/diheme cytochrome c family protein